MKSLFLLCTTLILTATYAPVTLTSFSDIPHEVQYVIFRNMVSWDRVAQTLNHAHPEYCAHDTCLILLVELIQHANRMPCRIFRHAMRTEISDFIVNHTHRHEKIKECATLYGSNPELWKDCRYNFQLHVFWLAYQMHDVLAHRVELLHRRTLTSGNKTEQRRTSWRQHLYPIYQCRFLLAAIPGTYNESCYKEALQRKVDHCLGEKFHTYLYENKIKKENIPVEDWNIIEQILKSVPYLPSISDSRSNSTSYYHFVYGNNMPPSIRTSLQKKKKGCYPTADYSQFMDAITAGEDYFNSMLLENK